MGPPTARPILPEDVLEAANRLREDYHIMRNLAKVSG